MAMMVITTSSSDKREAAVVLFSCFMFGYGYWVVGGRAAMGLFHGDGL